MFDDDEEDIDDDAETDDEAVEEEEEDTSELDEAYRIAEARECAKLRYEIDGLKRQNEMIRQHYSLEIRSIVEPLVGKHRALKRDTAEQQHTYDCLLYTSPSPRD